MKSARPVTPMRIFVPTEEEKTPVREAINKTVYCCVTNTRKLLWSVPRAIFVAGI
jgi:hypothetical protein